MSMPLEESIQRALKMYGESLLTPEGKADCFKRFGYNTWELACEWLDFNKHEHVVPERMIKKWEKERDAMDGIATQDTVLEW